MTTEKDKLNAEYEKFRDLYLHNNSESIYLLLTKNPEVMKYLTMTEKAGIAETILNRSNLKIQTLEKELNETLRAEFQ